jgi:hypothetical protein
LQRDLDDARKEHAPCPGLIKTLQKQLADESEQLEIVQKEHAPCEALISSLREQIANLQKKVEELEEGNQQEDDEPIIQMSRKQTRAVRSAPPPPPSAPEAEEDTHAIQFSTRPVFTRKVPMPSTHVVGLGMTIKTNVKLNKMVVTDIAAGGGACQSGQIEKGDMILGVASTPDAPIRVAQTLDQVHDWLLGPEGTQLVVQIEKANGQFVTVQCTRIRVENSENLALHDHSMDPNQGRLSPAPGVDMQSPETQSDTGRHTPREPSVLSGIYGGA